MYAKVRIFFEIYCLPLEGDRLTLDSIRSVCSRAETLSYKKDGETIVLPVVDGKIRIPQLGESQVYDIFPSPSSQTALASASSSQATMSTSTAISPSGELNIILIV